MPTVERAKLKDFSKWKRKTDEDNQEWEEKTREEKVVPLACEGCGFEGLISLQWASPTSELQK